MNATAMPLAILVLQAAGPPGCPEAMTQAGFWREVQSCLLHVARVQSVAPLFPHSPIITSMFWSPPHGMPRSPVASPPAVQPFSGGGAAGGASGQHFDQSARQAWVAAQKQRDALPLILHGNQTTFIENTSHLCPPTFTSSGSIGPINPMMPLDAFQKVQAAPLSRSGLAFKPRSVSSRSCPMKCAAVASRIVGPSVHLQSQSKNGFTLPLHLVHVTISGSSLVIGVPSMLH